MIDPPPNAGDLISFDVDLRFFASESKVWLDQDPGFHPANPFGLKELGPKAGQPVFFLGFSDYTTWSLLSEKYHTWTRMLWILCADHRGVVGSVAVMSFMAPYVNVISRIT